MMGFPVHVVSLDTSLEKGRGLRSAVAVAFTMPLQSGQELFDGLEIVDFGSEHVDGTASDLLADVDQETEFLQK